MLDNSKGTIWSYEMLRIFIFGDDTKSSSTVSFRNFSLAKEHNEGPFSQLQ